MRIIAGKYRGKKLISPDMDNVRPTADRAKESIFNILNARLVWQDCKIADIFCGSGALGLEALSRGAKEIYLVDIDLKTAKKNATLFESEKNNINFIQADVLRLPYSTIKFDVIFMDAPYNKNLTLPTLINIYEKNWLNKDGICVVEIEKNEKLVIPDFYKVIDERIYGLAKFLFLKKADN